MANATIRLTVLDRFNRPVGEDLRLCGECAATMILENPDEQRRLAPLDAMTLLGHDIACDHCEDREPHGVIPMLKLERGQWVLAMLLALLLPSLASAQSSSQLDNGVAGVSRPSVHDAERTPLSPRIAIIAGNLTDAISTEVMLQRGGVHEGNAILSQRMTQRLALKAAGTAAQVWMVRKLGVSHPRLARYVGFSAGAFFGGVTIHNLRVNR